MNILINVSLLNVSGGGFYHYSITLLKILGNTNSKHKFYIYHPNPNEELSEIIDGNDNFFHVTFSESTFHRMKRITLELANLIVSRLSGKHLFDISPYYEELFQKYNIDIAHTPYQFLIKSKSVLGISTMHDVQELHFPEFFSSAMRATRATLYKKIIDDSDKVIVSYNHVKNDMIKYFDKEEEDLEVVLLNMQDLWFESYNESNIKESIAKDFGIPDSFLLYPAVTYEHKNHIRLVEAIKYLKEEKGRTINLVCTGNKTEHYKKIRHFIELNDLESQIFFLGIVSNLELFSFYKKCKAVVVPTLYEAGSFPLMESILMGMPVICSNVTSLPETIEDKVFTFNPFDIEEMAQKIESIIFDRDFIERNQRNSEKISKKLKFNDAGAKILSIYEKMNEKKIGLSKKSI